MQVAETVVRGLHMIAVVGLFGAFVALLVAGPSDRVTALAWQRRTSAWARTLALAALVLGVAAVALQTAVLEQRPSAAIDARAILKLLLDTQGGIVWCTRLGLLLVLAAFVLMPADLRGRTDWRAARGECALLAAGGLALLAVAGHAAAVAPDARPAIAADMAHLLAVGAWGGALLPLALLCRAAARPHGADARPYAVIAVRRFSRMALAMVVTIVITGAINAWIEVGSVAGLLGTLQGRLLAAKLLVFAAVLVPAWLNRRDLGRLSGPAEAEGRPAMRRLARGIAYEALGIGVVLGITALMTAVPPARHASATWPLPFRLSVDALAERPVARPRVFLGSQVAVLGAAGIVAALVLRRRRLPVAIAGAVLATAGAALALPPLTVEAYPTTFQRPAVPYGATSIAEGGELYGEHCASCHGDDGRGDGPAGRGLIPPPADLRSGHAEAHTAGDLYWWVSHGRRGMPGFAGRLDAEQRWSLVNYVRALTASEAARGLGPTVTSDRERIVAPDFTFAVGPAPLRMLRDDRGRRDVLVVIYTLPGSRRRLADLASAYEALVQGGVEVIAVPSDAAPDAIRRLGSTPPVLFPVVTEGAADIVRTYSLFAPRPHAECLVDRAGYLRAISRGAGDIDTVLANAARLARETPAAPPAAHVH